MFHSKIFFSVFFIFAYTILFAQELEKEIKFSDHKYLPFYNFKKMGNTSIFQGNKKKNNYFEGWYFKMVAKDGENVISVIPGISLSLDGKTKHAFIQIINGKTSETNYFSYPIEEFSFSKKKMEIKIGENYFSEDKIILDINDEKTVIKGEINMTNNVEYSSGKLLNPGIMGWYRFVPFMECYHGVVSLTNDLKGGFKINNDNYHFNNGKGYIEKDWGSSMPNSWIWMQSNHFNKPNHSFMLSIADVPWLGKSFTGFLGFYYYENKIYHFSTYRNTKLNLEVSDSNILLIRIENRKNTFIVQAKSNKTGLLKAPVAGSMDRRIPESIDAMIKITMLDKKGNLISEDSTQIAGLEMVGEYKKLQGLLK